MPPTALTSLPSRASLASWDVNRKLAIQLSAQLTSSSAEQPSGWKAFSSSLNLGLETQDPQRAGSHQGPQNLFMGIAEQNVHSGFLSPRVGPPFSRAERSLGLSALLPAGVRLQDTALRHSTGDLASHLLGHTFLSFCSCRSQAGVFQECSGQ